MKKTYEWGLIFTISLLFGIAALTTHHPSSEAVASSACTEPSLMIREKYTYWASSIDFVERKLTVITWLSNYGANDAFTVVIKDSIPDNGVRLVSPVPVNVGNISAGQMASPYQLVYQLPLGVSDFQTISPATAIDACGSSYNYSFVSQNHATVLPDQIP